MGFKKINFKKIKGGYNDIKRTDNSIGIKDLKHDLQNQLVKISQKLENLRKKNSGTGIKTLKDQYRTIVNEYPEDAVESMVFIDRIVYQMFCELACITIIQSKSENLDAYKDKFKYKLHRVLLRVLLLYSDELSKNHIRYELEPSEEEWLMSEYVFGAIILKIIQNCTKYCKYDSTLSIKIKPKEIIFSMKSLKIDMSEKTKIFDNGYSGKYAIKSGKSSSGKGLFHAKELAKFHGLELSWEQDEPCIPEEIDGLKYCDNKFFIKLL